MSLNTIMWIVVAVSLAGCVAYAFILGNNARLKLKQQAEAFCTAVISDYPDYLASIASVEVREKEIKVIVKEHCTKAGKVYNPADFGLELATDSDKSEIANYLLDAMADGEWKKQMDRDVGSKQENANLLGFTIINITRIKSEHFKVA